MGIQLQSVLCGGSPYPALLVVRRPRLRQPSREASELEAGLVPCVKEPYKFGADPLRSPNAAAARRAPESNLNDFESYFCHDLRQKQYQKEYFEPCHGWNRVCVLRSGEEMAR